MQSIGTKVVSVNHENTYKNKKRKMIKYKSCWLERKVYLSVKATIRQTQSSLKGNSVSVEDILQT